MSEFGVVPTGFSLMRFQDSLAALQAAYVAIYGNPNLAPSSVIGQRINLEANVLAPAWEGLQLAYNSAFPSLCDEGSIDNIMALAGLTRKAATPTVINCDCVFSGPGAVQIGDLVSNSEGDLFSALEVLTVSSGSGGVVTGNFSCTKTGPTPCPPTDAIGINTTESHWASVNIHPVINVDCVFSGAATIPAGSRITNSAGFVFTAVNPVIAVTAGTITALFTWQTGGVAMPQTAGTYTITDAIAGWTSAAINATTALADTSIAVGTNLETLAESRVRRYNSLMIAGSATLAAITAAVLNNVPSVLACLGQENYTNFADSVPNDPHSIRIICQSYNQGTNEQQAIAEQIWARRAGGIAMNGGQSVTITDSTGKNQVVRFDYSTTTSVPVSVNYSLFSEDVNPPPVDINGALTTAITAAFAAQAIGEDVLYFRIAGACASVPGIKINTLTLNGVAGNYTIPATSLAVLGSVTPSVT